MKEQSTQNKHRSVNQLRKDVQRTAAKIQALNAKHRAMITQLIDTCTHPIKQIRQIEYVSSDDSDYVEPPFRICLQCGLAEEGWGCGYQILAPDTFELDFEPFSRRKAYELKTRYIRQS